MFVTQISMRLEVRQGVPALQDVASYSLVAVGLLCLVANASSWPLPASGALYAVGIWSILLVGGITFTLLILRRVL